MKQDTEAGLGFEVDNLTKCIENVISGDILQTEVSIYLKEDLIRTSKKNDWIFNWSNEFVVPSKEIYKLTIVNNPDVIPGLISLDVKTDHVYMHLIESAPFNKGKEKDYAGVPENLVAFACRLSFQREHADNLSFLSKTELIDHYEKSLGAFHLSGRIMIIVTNEALNLINR